MSSGGQGSGGLTAQSARARGRDRSRKADSPMVSMPLSTRGQESTEPLIVSIPIFSFKEITTRFDETVYNFNSNSL